MPEEKAIRRTIHESDNWYFSEFKNPHQKYIVVSISKRYLTKGGAVRFVRGSIFGSAKEIRDLYDQLPEYFKKSKLFKA